MAARRIEGGLQRGAEVRFEVDGRPMVAYAGETVAVALLAADRPTLRRTSGHGAPRGVFCCMGVCFDCAITIDGRPNTRACLTPVCDGMKVIIERLPDA